MFRNSSLFCYLKSGKIRRFNLHGRTVNELRQIFRQAFSTVYNADRAIFDAGYTNDDDCAYINDFALHPQFINCISDNTFCEDFLPNQVDYSEIKFIFMGRNEGQDTSIIFQKVRNRQIITRNFHIFTSRDTLELSKKPFLTITEKADCIYCNGMLIFKSFYDARQVFDLGQYYREATEADVQEFIRNDLFISDNEEQQLNNMDQLARRKVASIKDAQTLRNKTADSIQQVANQYDIVLELREYNGQHKVVLPTNKKELKTLLKFLDEDLYEGPLTGTRFETNSKRRR